MDFETLKKLDMNKTWLLIDEDGASRKFIGFNRAGYVVTDNRAGGNCTYLIENETKNWSVEEYIEPEKPIEWAALKDDEGSIWLCRRGSVSYREAEKNGYEEVPLPWEQ